MTAARTDEYTTHHHGQAPPTDDPRGRRGRRGQRSSRWVATALLLIVALAAGWWAARATVPRAPAEMTEPTDIVATAGTGSVGRSLTFGVTITRPLGAVASNQLSGVVTATPPLEQVAVGDEMYAVGGVPVRAVVGATPFYRDLVREASGADVRQLKDALEVLGYLPPSRGDVFTAAVERAVKSWQTSAKQTATGVVRLGELVALPSLPTAVQLGDDIALGMMLTGGETAVMVPVGDIRFSLTLTPDQAAAIPDGAAVVVPFDDHSWNAVVAQKTTDDTSNVVLDLVALDGGPVCGAECGLVPSTESTSVLATVQVVPQVEGTTVPVSAVRTRVDGSTYVRLATGESVPVTVSASSGGVAVVDGLEAGTEVLVSDRRGGEDA